MLEKEGKWEEDVQVNQEPSCGVIRRLRRRAGYVCVTWTFFLILFLFSLGVSTTESPWKRPGVPSTGT
jgi:hypothetical protein